MLLQVLIYVDEIIRYARRVSSGDTARSGLHGCLSILCDEQQRLNHTGSLSSECIWIYVFLGLRKECLARDRRIESMYLANATAAFIVLTSQAQYHFRSNSTNRIKLLV